MSDIKRLLFEIYNRPQDFVLKSDCVLQHIPSGQEVWFYMGTAKLWRPYKIEFTFWDRRRCYRAIKWWMRGARKEQRAWLRNWLCEPTTERIKVMERA